MKASFVVLFTTAAAVFAAPSPITGAETMADSVEARQDNCFHPSGCARNWSGNCEDYCGSWGFSHMSGDGCGFLVKKCCCIR